MSPKLVTLDSLCADAPDSAAVLLRDIPIDSLRSDADRAYHALLITQADYKAYNPATSDSLINLATDYYERHHNNSIDHERYVRTLVYHGTVAEELGRPTDALLWLKKAENAVPDRNHFWRGYIAMRIAKLYHHEYDENRFDVDYYREAINQFAMIGDKHYRLVCDLALGEVYNANELNLDSAEFFINHSLKLARELNDGKSFNVGIVNNISLLFKKEAYVQCAQLADSLISCEPGEMSSTPYCYGSRAYIRIGQTDNALRLISQCPQPQDVPDSLHYATTKQEYYDAVGLKDSVLFYEKLSHRIAEESMMASTKHQIKTAENQFDSQNMLSNYKTLNRHTVIALSLLSAVLLLIIFIVYYKSRLKTRKLEAEIRNAQNTLESMTENQTLVSVLADDMNLVVELIDMLNKSGMKQNRNPKKQLESVQEFFSSFRNDANVFWKKLEAYINLNFGNLIVDLEQKCPELSSDDVHVICLDCAKIPSNITVSLFNYSSLQVLYNRRREIQKKIRGYMPTFNYAADIKARKAKKSPI